MEGIFIIVFILEHYSLFPWSASFQHHNLGGGVSPEKNSDSSVSQLSAIATLRPIWGRVGQGAFELSLPQIKKWVTLACLDISTKKRCL